MTLWVVLVVIAVTGALVARRWLPDRSTVADAAYDGYRALVPLPRPTVRAVTKRVARVCRRQRVVMPFGHKAVLPRAFLIGLSPEEFAVIEPLLDTVQEAVGASLLRTAREKQWLHAGPPQVLVQPSETIAEGRPEVISTALPPPGSTAMPPPASTAMPPPASTALPPPGSTDRPPGPGYPPPTAATSSSRGTEATFMAGPAAPDSGAEGGREPTRTADPGPWYSTSAAGSPGAVVGAEPTRATGAPPPALFAIDGPVDLRAEPTAAETPAVAGPYVLHSPDGEPDIVVAGHTVDVGRSADCQVSVHYPSASRRHLRLTPTAAGCRLEDLGSRHGTRVNGVPVHQPVLLRARDTVQIGTLGPTWTYQPSYGAGVPDRPPLREVR